AQQIQDLLGGARATREHHDGVRAADERFETLLDVRHDDQLIDDRIGRLGGDDAGLGHADVTTVADTLLGMTDGGALHRALHRTRTAASAHAQRAQAEFVTDALGVVVLGSADGMTAPADHQVGPAFVIENPRVAQDVIDGVGDTGRIVQIETIGAENGIVNVDDVPQQREQMFLDAADHRAIDERARRRVLPFELDAPGLAAQLDLEVLVAVEDGAHVVGLQARAEHRQRAATEQLVDAATPRAEQLLNFTLRKVFQAAQ